jgi:DNA replication protein DnaC
METSAKACPQCGDTGWKPVESAESVDPAVGPAVDGAGRAGGIRRVVRCDCVAQGGVERRLRTARIPARYQHCDFESFSTNIHENPAFNQSLSKARVMAESFVRAYPIHADLGLLFMGPCGVGKTHLGVGLLRALVEKGTDCLFYDFRELLKEIQASYNPVVQTTEMQVLAPVLETEVLLLDDLGASKPSVWVMDTVAHILNTRYNEKRVTLITTNYLDTPTRRGSMREDTLADRIGERMRSRLYEMCKVVHIEAEDFRRLVGLGRAQTFR